MSERTRLLLVEDHVVLREMLAARLSQESDLQVVAAVGDAETLCALAASTAADLVVLDIDLPGVSPFVAARQLRQARPEIRIVFLSAYLRDGYLQQALAVQANGYLVKQDSLDAIVQGLRRVARGRSAFSASVRARITLSPAGVGLATARASRLSLLTMRELETLHYLARGQSRKQIAADLEISPKTVEQHCEHLMQKLDIHDRVELARFAIREGLLEA